MKRQTHKISFQNVETFWHNALPVGNGKIGAMVYYSEGKLRIALNHYDCYYHILYREKKEGTFDDPARREKTFPEIKALVDEARKQPDFDRSHYTRTLNPAADTGRPVYGGSSYPQGGEAVLSFSEKVDMEHSSLDLSVEEAKIRFTAGTGKYRVGAEIWAAPETDAVMVSLTQTEAGLWENTDLWRQEGRGQEAYVYEKKHDPECLRMWCRFAEDGQDSGGYVQETAVYIGTGEEAEVGSKIRWSGADETDAISDAGGIQLPKGRERLTVTVSLLPGEGCARRAAKELYNNSAAQENAHREKWKNFWKSSVNLPDRYLETLWHLYVYLMGCSIREGGKYPEQACGLSGLWDIRRPCMWGSMWYWDVNIQTAFYGTFASNHTEQAKVFCNTFLSYREDAREFAERIYGKKGWALDYPHPLYNCIQPWCALFLWKYYEYTGDEAFLREKAYPAFLEILDFYREISEKDGDGIRHIRYDICPEQGPVAEDTVITTAALKQLAADALRAAEILDRPEREKEQIGELLSGMPEYARTADQKRWKDSASVQDHVFLRHPSVLMPVFPAGEVHAGSPEQLRETAENAIRYAAENTEVGTFGSEWIAAAAARMGAGESAVRILCEKGLDLMTHTNGLGYEESERFINYCHLTKPANYLPVMCEFSGGVTEVINLLLLQEIDGVIHVFPAIPDGKDRYAAQKTQYAADGRYLSEKYGPWQECSFEGLLAPGGFEVSAGMREGRTAWIRVHCTADATLRIWLPEEIGGRVFSGEMHAGETVCFGEAEPSGANAQKDEENYAGDENPEVLVHHAAHTHRRIFLGENEDTEFYKAVDAFVCPYGYADQLHYPMTPYVFDFTNDRAKQYDDVYEKQIVEAERAILSAGGPRPVGAESYSAGRGYGFAAGMPRIVGRDLPDSMRKDFAEGTEETAFAVELPAGRYDLLVISGDEEESSLTHLAVPECGISLRGSRRRPGRYQCRTVPVVHERDGALEIVFHTDPGEKWKVNAIFINKIYSRL